MAGRARVGLIRALGALLLLLLAACATPPPVSLPTLAVLPTSAPTHAPSPTPAPLAATPNPSPTISPTPTTIPPTDTLPPITSIPALVGSINVTSAPGIALRRAPADDADVIAVVPGGTFVRAQGRSADGVWIEVVTAQGIAGWVRARDVSALVNLALLPAITAVPTAILLAPSSTVTPINTATPTNTPTATAVTLGDVPAMETRLKQTPILENLASQNVRAIFAAGQEEGNRANVFTTLGDSNTTNGDFLQPIGMNADAYCTWGSYSALKASVAYFSVPPKDGESNSFTHHSLAAHEGFSTASVLDPFWAPDSVCSDLAPLLCEYETIKPSVAIIMLGNIDVSAMSTADYSANMRLIVQTSIQQGVIPVLTTFVVTPQRNVYERSLEFNMALLDIAEQQLPLINLWAAAQSLPDDGIGPDGTHLKAVVGSFCSFDGAQAQDGGTLRNLLTLQALDQLRQNVLTQP